MANKKTGEQVVEESVSRLYEIGYLLVPTIDEGKAADFVDTIRSIIESAGGLIISEGQPQMIALAYDMDHARNNTHRLYNEAYFGWVRFQAGSEHAAAMQDALRAHENVIRFIAIKLPKDYTQTHSEPRFAVKQQKAEQPSGIVKEGEHEEVSDEALDEAINELVS